MQTPPTSPPPSWPQLLGSDHWSGLLDPLHPSLRSLILLSGDLCQVTYDAFISDPHSKYCGASRYGKPNLLSQTLFPAAADLYVADFLYATSELDNPLTFLFSLSREAWSKESNWIGYVAVSSDSAFRSTGRRDIFVAWRGTIRDLEWADVLQPRLVPIPSLLSSADAAANADGDDDSTPKVMNGWLTIYTSSDARSPFNKTSARDQLLSAVNRLAMLYKDQNPSVICVGHSLGASLAVLSAFDLANNLLPRTIPVCAVIFGGPQTGNKAFRALLDGHDNLRILRVNNKIDLIPLYPTGQLGYVHAGVELVVDTRKSPYLKDSKNPSDWHNLQAILHAVAGWNGEEGEFAAAVRRSVALVNKSSEFLKDELLVPGSWWVEKNKGMVRGGDGEWGLAPLTDGDVPVPPTTVVVAAAAERLEPKDVGGEDEGNGWRKLVRCFGA